MVETKYNDRLAKYITDQNEEKGGRIEKYVCPNILKTKEVNIYVVNDK